jgi:molecular chaperone GrpE
VEQALNKKTPAREFFAFRGISSNKVKIYFLISNPSGRFDKIIISATLYRPMDEQNTTGSADTDLGAGISLIRPETDPDPEDDVEIEMYNDDGVVMRPATPEERVRKLREKLNICKAEKQEYLDGWQRLKADFVNYKKRAEDEKAEFIRYSREGIITDLLPVLESFQMAFANKEAWEKVDQSWRMGVEHIHTQLMQTLTGYGLTEVKPLGKMFDPKEETSVGTIPTTDVAKYHSIAEVVQVGYRLGGRLIKSPKVKIYGDAPDAT